ncbi:hypothetical protein MKC73_01095 [[Clostridium] innocuum]|nr:hypothetical protein [[Clostridium] innocuum]
MKKKKRSIITIAIMSLLICGLLAKDSLSSLSSSIRQRILAQTDTVEIALVDDLQRSTPVVPGSRIPLSMEVRNLGADCAVRFKVSVYAGEELLRELTEEDLGLTGGWERKEDGYFYHTGFLEEDGAWELYDAVITDSGIITEEDQTLVLETTVQAIQSDHLEVSQDGWGDVKIQQTLHSRNEVRTDA